MKKVRLVFFFLCLKVIFLWILKTFLYTYNYILHRIWNSEVLRFILYYCLFIVYFILSTNNCKINFYNNININMFI